MFYLGMINLEGRFVPKDAIAAHLYFIEGAARNNAYCYFELSRIYSGEDETINLIDDKPSKSLQFLYLKRSAEEGFVHAQHCLAQAYRTGDIVPKDDFKALAWFRESVRNGNIGSYIEAAEILTESE